MKVKVKDWKVWAKVTQAFKSQKLYNRKDLKDNLKKESEKYIQSNEEG